MSNAYREIFRTPGSKGFAAAGFVARLPIAMAPIGIVAMLSQARGEYWIAGAVSATYTLINAVVAPQISRLVDRLGQWRVVVPTTIVSVIAFAALLVATAQNWPVWTLFVSALLAAAMPSIPAMVRARWTAVFRDRPGLDTAFAFESAADELVYIAGASLSVGLSVAWFPEAGVLVSTLFLAFGSAAFILQRSTEPGIGSPEHGTRGSAIRQRPVQIITFALIFVGAIFATAEVSTVAITKDLGQPSAATLVIGVYAAGSFVVGLIVGALNLTMPLQRRLAIAVGVIALTTLPLLVVDTVPLLALAIFVSGVGVSYLHHRLRPDRAPRTASDADGRYYLGDDRHRHRHRVGIVCDRLGGGSFRRAPWLLGGGGGRHSRVAHRAPGSESACAAKHRCRWRWTDIGARTGHAKRRVKCPPARCATMRRDDQEDRGKGAARS